MLAGRSAIITGANQGLGLEIARAYVAAGARVLICARDGAKLEEARAELGANAIAEVADVSREEDVQRVVDRALRELGSVQILVNNAGVYGPFGVIEDVDWLEWTRAMEINLYGSILPCRALLPHFRAQRYGKIVQVSGGGATNPLPRITAYAASKAAVVRFAESLAEETRGTGIDVNSIAPGALNTRLLDEVLAAGPEKVGEAFYARMIRQKEQGGAPLGKGAALAVFLASAASDGISGKLLSAVWDPWSELAEHSDDLQTDIYTLRRIVPKDRGMKWGGE
ncbi:MAG TPA: SDR family oxidoreductase [Thermoanaerobaculia bacterium]|nr:SDR family oxidoreductase [Thermoanaerobaculia bacterium]